MKLLDRYIANTVVAGTVIALLVLLVLLGFIYLVDELGNTGRGQYQVADALFFVILLVPRLTYEVFPIAVLLGSLIGLSWLAAHSELIAIRAAGVSYSRIVYSVLRTGLLMIIVVLLVGELIAPKTEQYARQMRAEQRAEQITLKTRYGFWSRDGDAFINIRTVLPGARLADIAIYEFEKNKELRSVTHAASASYQNDHWLLKDIRRSRITPEGVETQRLDQTSWASLLDPDILNVLVVNPNMLPVWELYRYIDFMRSNGQDAKVYEVTFWGKLLMPVVTLIMLYLSTPAMFGVLRSIGMGQRLLIGILLGCGFFLLNRAFSFMALVYDLNPLFAAGFPALAFLSLAFWLSRRVH